MHSSGQALIDAAKEDGTWTLLDDVENGVVPPDLQKVFNRNKRAFQNFQNFTRSQRKSYLYWLHQAKREETRQKRITEILANCKKNIKSRDSW